MNSKIDTRDFLKHLSFWYNKTDDECTELATNENDLDAEQGLRNMLERDLCTEIVNETINELKKFKNE